MRIPSRLAIAMLLMLNACGRVGYVTIDAGQDNAQDGAIGVDSAVSDGGIEDSGVDDGGVGDSGVDDGGVGDGGFEDSSVGDSGFEDSGVEDSGFEDSGVEDSGVDDGGSLPAVLELASPPRIVNRLDEARFSGTCSEDVEVTGAETRTFPCVSGAFEVVVTATTDGQRDYMLSLQTAMVTPIPVTWIRDRGLPRVLSLSLDNGATVSRDPTLSVRLSGVDDLSNIVAFCLDWRSRGSAPLPNDECFVNVAAPSPGLVPARNLNLTAYDYLVGFGAATYAVKAWLLDEAGNVSTLSDVNGVDRDDIEYRPGLAPILTDVWAANTRTPSTPVPDSALVVGSGTSVYIGWAARDDEALPATPISIYYTTDERTYVPIATGLANGSNGGCTVNSPGTSIDDLATGCFRWTSSLIAGFYARIRVIAEDAIGQRSAASSWPFNLQGMRVLAGNFDPGTDASGRAAIFAGAIPVGTGDDVGVSGLAVSRDGTIYFRDIVRGIMMIEPEDGVQRILVPLGPTSSGDGGPASAATVRLPYRFALDHRDRLLIFDYDRIRRIDLTRPDRRIETLIGGGSQTGDTAAALDVSIVPPSSTYGSDLSSNSPFFALPNGDVIFASDAYGAPSADGGRFRRYHEATGMVDTIRVSGTVSELNPGQDVRFCKIPGLAVTYDLVTSNITRAHVTAWAEGATPLCPSPSPASAFVSIDFNTGTITGPGPTPFSTGAYWKVTNYAVQGMNGRLYLMSRSPARIFEFNPGTNAFVPIVGTGIAGRCDDGTPALMCDVTPVELFVDARGQLYFLDSDVIRVIDETGAVRTVLGQRLDFGDGEVPSSARFSTIPQLETWNDGTNTRIVVIDPNATRLREIRIGIDVDTIAGNGRNATATSGVLASGNPLLLSYAGNVFHGFGLEPNGTVWMARGIGVIASFDRMTERWVDRMGGGTRSFFQMSTDGTIGSDVNLSPAGFATYPSMILGLRPGAVLAHKHTADPTSTIPNESLIFEAATTDGRLDRILGREGAFSQTRCADGTSVDSCAIWRSHSSLPAQWDAANSRWLWARRNDVVIRTIGSTTIGTLASVTTGLTGFVVQANTLHWCGTDGVMRRRQIGMSDTIVPLPPGMRCAGGMRYVNERASIVFSFDWNSLGGVAELTTL